MRLPFETAMALLAFSDERQLGRHSMHGELAGAARVDEARNGRRRPHLALAAAELLFTFSQISTCCGDGNLVLFHLASESLLHVLHLVLQRQQSVATVLCIVYQHRFHLLSDLV